MPEVSVIVPNYNHARFLEQRLNSILSQTYRDFELIILDDCSTDDSKSIIEAYRSDPHVKQIVFNPRNTGSAFAQWKKGIGLATSNYIWIAESDDFVSPDFLESAMEHLKNGADLFYCRSVVATETGDVKTDLSAWYNDITRDLDTDYSKTGSEELTQHLFYKNTIVNASSVVFRKFPGMEKCLDQISSMRYCGDWIFWMNCVRNASRIDYSVAPVNYFRSHSAVTRKEQKHAERNAEMNEVLDFILKEPLSKSKRREIVRYFMKHHLFIRSRRSLRWNFELALKQVRISSLFVSWWFTYYFSGKRE